MSSSLSQTLPSVGSGTRSGCCRSPRTPRPWTSSWVTTSVLRFPVPTSGLQRRAQPDEREPAPGLHGPGLCEAPVSCRTQVGHKDVRRSTRRFLWKSTPRDRSAPGPCPRSPLITLVGRRGACQPEKAEIEGAQLRRAAGERKRSKRIAREDPHAATTRRLPLDRSRPWMRAPPPAGRVRRNDVRHMHVAVRGVVGLRLAIDGWRRPCRTSPPRQADDPRAVPTASRRISAQACRALRSRTPAPAARTKGVSSARSATRRFIGGGTLFDSHCAEDRVWR